MTKGTLPSLILISQQIRLQQPTSFTQQNPARDNVAPTVEIPYSNKDTKEVYVYGGEANSFDIKFKDDSGKIASATVKQGGNREFDPVTGEADTIQYSIWI